MFGLGALTSLTGGGGIGGDTSSAKSGYVTTGGFTFAPAASSTSSWIMPAALIGAALILMIALRK